MVLQKQYPRLVARSCYGDTIRRRRPRGRDSKRPLATPFVPCLFLVILLAVGSAEPLLRGSHHVLYRNSTDIGTIPSSAVWTLPLHARSGTHHLDLVVGQPAQKRTLIVDTGSRLTAWVCKECRDCGVHANPAYGVAASSTAVVNSCGRCDWPDVSTSSDTASSCQRQRQQQQQKDSFHLPDRHGGDPNSRCSMRQRYTEGSSWAAHEVNDIVILPVHSSRASQTDQPQSPARNNTIDPAVTALWQQDGMETTIPFTFGCQTSVHSLFRGQYADGILGLERTEKSLVHQLFVQGLLPESVFSLCLTREQGIFGLGGAASSVAVNGTTIALEPMRFTPLGRHHGWYAVTIMQVYMRNNKNETVSVAAVDSKEAASFHRGKGTILDSGTTDTYLPAAIANAFAAAWLQLTGLQLAKQRAHRYTYQEFLELPSVILILQDNVTLSIPAANYMEGLPDNFDYNNGNDDGQSKAWSDTRELTNRVYVNEPTGAVLGLNAMFGYDILYDSDGDRVGIARANCQGR